MAEDKRIREEAERRYNERFDGPPGVADQGPVEGSEPGPVTHGLELESGREDPEAVLQELRIHQIELQIQNEELRRAQLELERSRTAYKELYEFAPVGYLIATSGAIIRSTNLRLAEMAGRQRGSLMDASVYGLVRTEDRPAVVSLFRHALEYPGTPFAAEVRMEGPDGLHVHLDAVARAPDDEDVVLVSVTDVGRARKAEQRAELAAQHNALLVRELNHRIKNNLQLLRSLVTLQLRRSDSTAVREALGAVEARIRAVVHAYESLDPNKLSSTTDLASLLSALAGEFRAGAEVTFQNSAGSVLVPGDRAFTVSLAVNELLANAAKYAAPDGGAARVVLRLRVSQDGERRRIAVTVADFGPGLPEDILLEGARVAGGTSPESGGLGMVLVGQLTDQLGGTWKRRNPPDGGAEHTVEFVV